MRNKEDLIIEDVGKLDLKDSKALESYLEELGVSTHREIKYTMENLLNAIYQVFGLTIEDLKSNRKDKSAPYARRIFFYHARRLYPSYRKIHLAALLNRNHSTFLYAIAAYEAENNEYNPEFREMVNRVNEAIGVD